MTINRTIFYDNYKREFGSLQQAAVNGLNALLLCIEADTKITVDVRYVAYALATIRLESAGTYTPVPEIGKGRGKPYGSIIPSTGKAYYGRGYVQVTWLDNYRKLTGLWNAEHPTDTADFVADPDLLLQAKYAWFTVSYPMLHGTYTGHKLSDYIDAKHTDYTNARQIINGHDKADTIAKYASGFQDILMKSITHTVSDPSTFETLATTLSEGVTGAVSGAVPVDPSAIVGDGQGVIE